MNRCGSCVFYLSLLVFATLLTVQIVNAQSVNFDKLTDEEYEMLVYGDSTLTINKDTEFADEENIFENEFALPDYLRTVNSQGQVISRFMSKLFALSSMESVAQSLLSSHIASPLLPSKSKEREEKDAYNTMLRQKAYSAAVQKVVSIRNKLVQPTSASNTNNNNNNILSQAQLARTRMSFSAADAAITLDPSVADAGQSFVPPSSSLNCRNGKFVVGNTTQLICSNVTVSRSAIVNNTISLNGTLYNVTQVNTTTTSSSNITTTVVSYYINQNGLPVLLNASQLSINQTSVVCRVTPIYQSGCVCPIDWVGTRCSVKREFMCSVSLVHPKRACIVDKREHGGLMLDGDFSCIRLTKQESNPSTFLFNMTCSFTAKSSAVVDEAYFNNNASYTVWPVTRSSVYSNLTDLRSKSFSYFYYKDETFAQTKQVTDSFYFKIFNFYKFSIDTGVKLVLSGPMFTGDALIPIAARFDNISADYFAGNRLYVEAGFPYVDRLYSIEGLTLMNFERLYIDFTDLVEQMDGFKTGRTVVIVVASVIGGLLLAGVAVGLYLRQRNKEKAEEREQDQYLFDNDQQHHYQAKEEH